MYTTYDLENLYVRVLKRPALKKDVDEPDYPTNIIKFGSTTSLHHLHEFYEENPDDGFLICSFPLPSAKVDIIKAIVEIDYKGVMYKASRNDVQDALVMDTIRLSRILKMPHGGLGADYDDYIVLAERFFLTIVRLVKSIWPDKHNNFGYIYRDRSTSASCLKVEREEITDAVVARNAERQVM